MNNEQYRACESKLNDFKNKRISFSEFIDWYLAKEICICAAVKTTTGKIFRGHRHSDCMEAIRDRLFIVAKEQNAQGFITSLNRYVDREEGYRLQIEAGIKSENPNGYCQEGFLYSEDLY